MNAKCCDRCGKFYIPSLEANKDRKRYKGMRVDLVRLCCYRGNASTGHMYELCPECANELVAFMSHYEPKESKVYPEEELKDHDDAQETVRDTYDNFGVGENNEERNDTDGEEGEA